MKKQRLYITVFASAILHLAMFTVWWHGHDPVIVSSTTHGSPLNISISQPAVSQSVKRQPKVAPKIKVSPAKVKPAKTAIARTDTQQVEIATMTDGPATDTTNEQETNNHAQDFALINNHMIDYLSAEFKLRFKYPVLARKRGWQGEVLLWLEINTQGEISNIAIKRSSGYKLLDRNAVKTFELIAIISPELKTELATKIARNHRLSIPVIYKLTGS